MLEGVRTAHDPGQGPAQSTRNLYGLGNEAMAFRR
jgi:hypothetical protein